MKTQTAASPSPKTRIGKPEGNGREAPMSLRLDNHLRRIVVTYCKEEDLKVSQLLRRALRTELQRLDLLPSNARTTRLPRGVAG